MPARQTTILIPHRNRPDLLERALASVSNQTVPPDEILVLDDCSSPEVRQQIRKFRGIATIHENSVNLGVSRNINHGAELARTEWIGILADDDQFLPRKLELQHAYLDQNPHCDIVGSPVRMVHDRTGDSEIWGFIGPRELHLKDALVHTAVLLQTALMRRETYLALGGLCQPPLEDQDFGIRALQARYRIHMLQEPTVIYSFGNGDHLSENWSSMFRAQMAVIHRFSSLYRQEFGQLGAIKMYGRQLNSWGIRRGRFIGRGLWALGCITQGVLGDPFRAWDRPTIKA